MPPLRIGFIGAGQMGAGIAQVAAQAGHAVLPYDVREGAADQAKAYVASIMRALGSRDPLEVLASTPQALRDAMKGSPVLPSQPAFSPFIAFCMRSAARTACSAPSAAWSSKSTDCDDTKASVNPGAKEICGNGVDDDCNGLVDDGC